MPNNKPYRDLRGNPVSNASSMYTIARTQPTPTNTPVARGGAWDARSSRGGEQPPVITPQMRREAEVAQTILKLKEEFYWLAGNEKAEQAVGVAATEAMRNDINLPYEKALRTAAEMLTSLGGEFARPASREQWLEEVGVREINAQRAAHGLRVSE